MIIIIAFGFTLYKCIVFSKVLLLNAFPLFAQYCVTGNCLVKDS